MRFVFAIVTFVVAAIMIAAGFAQRTVWAPPSNYSVSASVPKGTDFLVVGGGTLNALEGQQVLTVSGSAKPFVAYGRTADVLAWLHGTPYTRLSFQGDSDKLAIKTVSADGTSNGSGATQPSSPPPGDGTATTAPSDATAAAGQPVAGPTVPAAPVPDGSDLWLQQFSGASADTTRMNVPDGISVIISGSEGAAAPDGVKISWPLDGATPWSGPLIVGGAVLLLVGLLLYFLALRSMRRSRGPRRGGQPPKMPRTPRSRRVRSVAVAVPETHGRRSTHRAFVAVPVLLAGALALSGCTSNDWPSFGGKADSAATTPTLTPLTTQPPAAAGAPQPAVTEPQLDEIIARVSKVADTADAAGDAALAATRFTGAALTERTVNYKIRHKFASYAAPQSIPAGEVQVALPQATDSWPRVVSAVVKSPSDTTQPPLDLVLVQQTPRDNYKVEYVMALGAAEVTDLPPASVGTALVPPDSKLLAIAPGKLASAYSGVLAKGTKSMYYKLFDEASDTLTPQIGAAFKQKQIKDALKGKSSALVFKDSPGANQPVALATNDSGALVATTVDEIAIVRVTEKGATVRVSKSTKGAAVALAGKTTSSTGFSTTYEYQLLFYVPPAGSDEKIRLIGYTQAAIAAQELK